MSVFCSDMLNYHHHHHHHRVSSIKHNTGEETQNLQCVGLKKKVSEGTNNSEVAQIIHIYMDKGAV